MVQMKRILVLDGGGAKGLIQSEALAQIEKAEGQATYDKYDLIIGTSVGSILGGAIASGKVSATEINEEMKRAIPVIFKKQLGMFFRKKKYTRAALAETIDKIVGQKTKANECSVKFIAPSVDDLTGITHFFKSWEEKDGELLLKDIMLRSAAAPVYFGGIPQETPPAYWIDGGVGIENNPTIYAVIEALRQGWTHVHIDNFGTGFNKILRILEDIKDDGIVAQAINFIKGGGYAHRTAERSIARYTSALCAQLTEYTYHRYNPEIKEEANKMDNIKAIPYYAEIGKQVAETYLQAQK